MMENQKKLLSRVRLINWHYFENECISMNGSTLISGENTAGKSTIMDAIAMVLTTNTKKFNVAANVKGNRNLTGYIRCKLGNLGENYLRKNIVPANIALEFYEEKTERYFVVGVHMVSYDEESTPETKWYIVEDRLESLSFIVDGKAALAKDFKKNGQKISYIEQKNVAKDRIKRRLGNLEDKFFDIIPKSLAFKPMDNVKDFINKFVLSEEKIDVELLRENIENMSELEETFESAKRRLSDLAEIIVNFETLDSKQRDICINDFLLRLASVESLKNKIDSMKRQREINLQCIESNKEKIDKDRKLCSDIREQITNIELSIKENESSRIVEELNRQLMSANNELEQYKKQQEILKQKCKSLKDFLKELVKLEYRPVSVDDVKLLESEAAQNDKIKVTDKIKYFQNTELEGIYKVHFELYNKIEKLNDKINDLHEIQKSLEQRKLTYPEKTTSLKNQIEKEFQRRGIFSKVYVLAELLEIRDIRWINAIEGYLNKQKFYLIVDPEYYDIALECYHKNRRNLHSAGIINTKKIPLSNDADKNSLANIVTSDNRYAKAYSDYLLGRVIRCDDIKELENYDIAITPDCMLYQGYVARNINPEFYRNPFIGQNAYRTQLENVKKEIEELGLKRKEFRNKQDIYKSILDAEKNVNLEMLISNMAAPSKVISQNELIDKLKTEKKKAEKNPTLIALNVQKENKNKEYKELEKEIGALNIENGELNATIKRLNKDISEGEMQQKKDKSELESLADEYVGEYKEAEGKYRENRKTKTSEKIVQNFSPQKSQFENEKDTLLNGNNGLKDKQRRFNQKYNTDYKIGEVGRKEYYDALQNLESVEIVKYEEKLRKSKEDCEEIFKSDFLSKMKERIEAAKNEFRNLNKALAKTIYGDDIYHFHITFDKHKEGLYRMITSENNQEGYNLWTSQFENEYKEEMSELFDKLMTKDDNGKKIVEEYTDYRSYLDYDIEIHKKDGSKQRFSSVYGEKSGSETQVPYYVAIAASFYQLYRFGNSVRLMLLDEAFDKMDDERIASMMDFFNELNLQVILATPPSKIEVIGERVGTVITAIREGKTSICEEYDF